MDGGEYEKLVRCINQIIHLREFKGQIVGGNISFTTVFSPATNGTLFFYMFYVIIFTLVPHSFFSVLLKVQVPFHMDPEAIKVPVF